LGAAQYSSSLTFVPPTATIHLLSGLSHCRRRLTSVYESEQAIAETDFLDPDWRQAHLPPPQPAVDGSVGFMASGLSSAM
jgi:hypothetical protein